MFKVFIKKSIRKLGFELRRYAPGSSDAARLMAMLSAHEINLVFDVGANIGQFGEYLRSLGYRGRIVSFEPLPLAWTELVATSRKDPLWEVAERFAVGDKDGEVEINIAGNSVSSSVLPMLDTHLNAAPDSAYVGRLKLPLRRLDSIGVDYLRRDSKLFLKIDTQGFESQVLEGASSLLSRTVGLHMELSIVRLYEGQYLFDQMIAKLERFGFKIWAITPGFTDSTTGRLLQMDAVFFRS